MLQIDIFRKPFEAFGGAYGSLKGLDEINTKAAKSTHRPAIGSPIRLLGRERKPSDPDNRGRKVRRPLEMPGRYDHPMGRFGYGESAEGL